ncbi:MAG: hypothetical protein SAK29_01895 [Scytonema sp. PMC 1069.18]|nr:hypothetical protein [Scytonema sp. PMC 1069.18]MEC4882101.1 hypothetical protein [Scytonema sp. PMC 1070.18]
MLKGHPLSEIKGQYLTGSEKLVHGQKNLKLMEVNYRRNQESDYTEQMEHLYKTFDYDANKDYFWGLPELSILYGSPVYEMSSPEQKKALNHLYWAFHYYATAGTENNTIFYNQITASAFFPYKDYEILCHVLDVETSQERYHINTFHTIGNATEMALMGELVFGCTRSTKPDAVGKEFEVHKGLAGRAAPPLVMQLYTANFANSPFLATQYYAARGIGNLHLKNKEYGYTLYYKELEKKGDFIPAPTQAARLHLLDESFHTATSQLISHDLYKDFPQPTAYEKFMANMMIYMLQRNVLKGMSGVIPGCFAGDGTFIMPLIYKLLQTPLFGMSSQEALEIMEQCFCQEHEGFQIGYKYHQRLLGDLRKFLESLDYLWPVNREMHLMESVSSIDKAIKNNITAFKRFSHSVLK